MAFTLILNRPRPILNFALNHYEPHFPLRLTARSSGVFRLHFVFLVAHIFLERPFVCLGNPLRPKLLYTFSLLHFIPLGLIGGQFFLFAIPRRGCCFFVQAVDIGRSPSFFFFFLAGHTYSLTEMALDFFFFFIPVDTLQYQGISTVVESQQQVLVTENIKSKCLVTASGNQKNQSFFAPKFCTLK